MSSYLCPRCGKAILDAPGGPHETHWCTPKEIIAWQPLPPPPTPNQE